MTDSAQGAHPHAAPIFDTEHNLFRNAFAAFLGQEVLPHQEQWEEAGVVSRELWRKAGAMGFLLPWADTVGCAVRTLVSPLIHRGDRHVYSCRLY